MFVWICVIYGPSQLNNKHDVCYGLNVCAPTKCVSWNQIPSVIGLGGRAFGRWLGHEGRALISENNVFIKGPQKAPSPLLPREDTGEVSCLKPGGGSSSELDHGGTLTSDFQPPELWKANEWLSHPVYGNCSSIPNGLRWCVEQFSNPAFSDWLSQS